MTKFTSLLTYLLQKKCKSFLSRVSKSLQFMFLKFDLRMTKTPTTTMKSDMRTCKVTLRHWHVIYTPFGRGERWQGSSEGTGTRMRQGGSAAFQPTPAGKRERTVEMIYSDSNHERDSESLVSAPHSSVGSKQ